MDAWGQRELPRRAAHAVSRELDGEFIVLNTETDEAHHLAGDVARLWEALETRAAVELSIERVSSVIDELSERGLLAPGTHSRRALLRIGTVGGAAVAVAGIQTLVLPEAAWAGSNPLPIIAPGTYQVPTYVSSLNFTLVGASGGGGSGDAAGGLGGVGGRGLSISGNIQLPANQTTPFTVQVLVGAPGIGGVATGSNGTNGGQGFSAGGSGGRMTAGGGGGASAILINGVPVVVAGGGGGGGRGRDSVPGGNGGSASGFNADGSSPIATVSYAASAAISLTTAALGTFSTNVAADTLTFSSPNATNVAVGNVIRFTAQGSTLNGTGLATGTDYRIATVSVNAGNTTVTLTTGTGVAVNVQGNPGTNPSAPTATVQAAVSFASGSTSVVYPNSPGLAVGDKVTFGGLSGGAGFANATQYFVTELVNTRTIKVSATEGGTPIAPTSFGTATSSTRLARQVTLSGGGNGTNGSGGAASGGISGTTAGTSPSGPSSGNGTAGPGGTGGGGAAGASGTIVGSGASATRTGGLGGVNGTSSNRTGGGGGGGWGPGGGGQAGVSGGDFTSGAGGGAGSSYYGGGYSVSISSTTVGASGGTAGPANGNGGTGGTGSVSISAGP